MEAANLRWLAGYRQPRFAVAETVALLRGVFAVPRPLAVGARWCGPAATALPVLFHLLWHGQLETDLTTPLSESSLVTCMAGA